MARFSSGTYSPSPPRVSHWSLVNSQISTSNSFSTSRLRCAVAGGIRCASIGFSCGSTIELPLKGPTGSVIRSGSIRKRMPMVGRLEVMVKPMPASCSRRTASLARVGQDFVLGQQRAVDIGDDERDAGHGRFLRAGALSEGASLRSAMMSSTMASTGASIDTVTGFSLASGGSSVLNWLSSSPGGMK